MKNKINKANPYRERKRSRLLKQTLIQYDNQAKDNLHPDQDVVVAELSKWILNLISEIRIYRKV